MESPLKLEIKMQCHRPFPEVGVELRPAAAVRYAGTDVTPPNSKVVFTWSKDLFLPSPLKVWTVIGSSATYIPSKDDVGHCLRIPVYGIDWCQMALVICYTFWYRVSLGFQLLLLARVISRKYLLWR